MKLNELNEHSLWHPINFSEACGLRDAAVTLWVDKSREVERAATMLRRVIRRHVPNPGGVPTNIRLVRMIGSVVPGLQRMIELGRVTQSDLKYVVSALEQAHDDSHYHRCTRAAADFAKRCADLTFADRDDTGHFVGYVTLYFRPGFLRMASVGEVSYDEASRHLYVLPTRDVFAAPDDVNMSSSSYRRHGLKGDLLKRLRIAGGWTTIGGELVDPNDPERLQKVRARNRRVMLAQTIQAMNWPSNIEPTFTRTRVRTPDGTYLTVINESAEAPEPKPKPEPKPEPKLGRAYGTQGFFSSPMFDSFGSIVDAIALKTFSNPYVADYQHVVCGTRPQVVSDPKAADKAAWERSAERATRTCLWVAYEDEHEPVVRHRVAPMTDYSWNSLWSNETGGFKGDTHAQACTMRNRGKSLVLRYGSRRPIRTYLSLRQAERDAPYRNIKTLFWSGKTLYVIEGVVGPDELGSWPHNQWSTVYLDKGENPNSLPGREKKSRMQYLAGKLSQMTAKCPEAEAAAAKLTVKYVAREWGDFLKTKVQWGCTPVIERAQSTVVSLAGGESTNVNTHGRLRTETTKPHYLYDSPDEAAEKADETGGLVSTVVIGVHPKTGRYQVVALTGTHSREKIISYFSRSQAG